MVIQGVSYLSDFEAKKAIIAAASKLYQRGWMIAGDGSLSVKVGPNAIWVTIEGADKSALTQDQLVRIDQNGKQMATNKPKPLGDDIETHLRIYKENDRVRSIVHAYPIAAQKLAARGKSVEAAAFTPAVRRLGRVQTVGALKSEQVISDVSLLAKNDNGVIVQGDGCMMWGKTPQEAADYVEVLNYYCEAAFVMAEEKAQPPLMVNAQASGFMPISRPGCTADCSVCGNAGCRERRTGVQAYYPIQAAPTNSEKTEGKSCDGSCDTCSFIACADRKASKCIGNCVSCGDTACAHRNEAVTDDEAAYTSAILSSGMTGIIRPGEALPDIPDESTDDRELKDAVIAKSVNASKVMYKADNGLRPGVYASGTVNAGLHNEKPAVSKADTVEKNAGKAQVMANVVRHLTGI